MSEYRVNQLPPVLFNKEPTVRATGSQIKIIHSSGPELPFVEVKTGKEPPAYSSNSSTSVKIYSNSSYFLQNLINEICSPVFKLMSLCKPSLDYRAGPSGNRYYVEFVIRTDEKGLVLISRLIKTMLALADQEGVEVKNREKLENLLIKINRKIKEIEEEKKSQMLDNNHSRSTTHTEEEELLIPA
mgnify:CR=1 FL=1